MKELPACLDIDTPNTELVDDFEVTATPAALDLLAQIQAYHESVSRRLCKWCRHVMSSRRRDVRRRWGCAARHGPKVPVFVFGRGALDWDDRQFVLDSNVGHCGGFSLDIGTGRQFFVPRRHCEKSGPSDLRL